MTLFDFVKERYDMAYSELIKNFNRIRTYLRSFYVYGFRHRDEFTQKSARSYDNERRRVESWLGEYMSFGQDEEGRRVFLSVDSRAIPENPLYRAFRTKSFTDRDITLHFHILDILKVTGGLSITSLMDELADRLSVFETGELPDESTVRKKLREYASLGIVSMEKRGRKTFYVLSEDHVDLQSWETAISFFSESVPLGVIGSFVQDHMLERFQKFRFKHHYILNALDSETLYELFIAIGERKLITFTTGRQHVTALPLKVYIGTQTGRQYLLAWTPANDLFSFYRADLIDNIKMGDVFGADQRPVPQSVPARSREVDQGPVPQSAPARTGAVDQKPGPQSATARTGAVDPSMVPQSNNSPDLEKRLNDFCSHVWGATGNNHTPLTHIEMTVFVNAEEGHIVERLHREKRCGTVEQLDDTHWRFSADVYEAFEMLPWLRTFTGRITDLQCTDKKLTARFWKDFKDLTQMYGLEE